MRKHLKWGPKMIARSFLVLMIASASIVSTQTVASADDAQPRFQLRAQVSDKFKMSRAELDSSALDALTPSKAQKMALATPPTNPLPVPKKDSEPVDNSYLQEFSVDWSSWVAGLADRWFYVLRAYEDSNGMQFVTSGPALIQFTCYSNGQIGNVSIKQSSGNAVYDQLQMVALMQATPLAPFPKGTKRTSITLLQGWESHLKQPGDHDFIPGSFGQGFPMEKVKQWIKAQNN